MPSRSVPVSRYSRGSAEVRAAFLLFRPPLHTLARDKLVFRAIREVRTADCLLLEHGDELTGTAPEQHRARYEFLDAYVGESAAEGGT